MKNCWTDGDMRTYIDGELPEESLQQIAAHLQICPQCSERYRELSDRAARVSALMGALSEATPIAPAAPPLPSRNHRRWPLIAFPLAASVAIAFLVLPRHRLVDQPARLPSAHATVAAANVQPPAAKPRPRVRHIKPQTPPPEEFVRLDDEPFETGTVVHMAADNGNLEADLIIGPDGRAHAIRVVANQ